MATRTPTVITGTWTGIAGSGTTFMDNALVTTLGWTILQTATNRRIYRPATGPRPGLLFDDRGTVSTGLGRDVFVRGCDPASTFATLVNPFPTVAQVANNQVCIRKSDTADATARNVTLIGDDRGFVLYVEQDTPGLSADTYIASQMINGWSGDSYNFLLTVRNQSAAGALGNSIVMTSVAMIQGAQVPNTVGTAYFMRSPDGLVTSCPGGLRSSGNGTWNQLGIYPDTSTTKLNQNILASYSTRSQTVGNVAVMRRGVVPFMFELSTASSSGIAPGDTYTDTDYDAAAEFLVASEFVTIIGAGTPCWGLQTDGTFDPKATI